MCDSPARMKLLSLCSAERGWEEQSCKAEPSPGERQRLCRSCRCTLLAGPAHNEFAIKAAAPSRLSAPCLGGIRLQLRCAVIQDRKAKPARPKGSAGGIQGDRKQLNSLEFVQVLGLVTPFPTKLGRPHVTWISTLCLLREAACRAAGPQWCEAFPWYWFQTQLQLQPLQRSFLRWLGEVFALGALAAALARLDSAGARELDSHVNLKRLLGRLLADAMFILMLTRL